MLIGIVGATGVLGQALAPLLLGRGHAVRALVRRPGEAPARQLADWGAAIAAFDLLAPDAADRLPSLLAGCDAVIHAATAIPRDATAPGAWEANTRLRTEGTRRLLDAALTAGVRRYLQQSIVMAYPDGGDRWLDESTPIDDSPASVAVRTPVIAMEGMVRAVPVEDLRWCILRGGVFVGPMTRQDTTIERLRAGVEVVPCGGRSFMSLVHVADVAAAFAAALERAPAGSVFNINDEPIRQGEYLDRLAAIAGAPPPRPDPSLPCPPSQRCSNTAARTVLGWAPVHGIWPDAPTIVSGQGSQLS